jgi:hypothetical protein
MHLALPFPSLGRSTEDEGTTERAQRMGAGKGKGKGKGKGLEGIFGMIWRQQN